MLSPIASPETIKELNRRLVFDQIRQHTISRVEIAQATKLSKAAVSLIVAELIGVGIVEETGNGKSAAGRPRVLLQLVNNARLALGAELTNEESRVVLTNLGAETLVRIVRPTTDNSFEGLLTLLATCVAEATQGVDQEAILGLGVSIPGVVHSPEGLVIAAVLLGWQQVRLGQELMRRFPWPVAVFSRGNAGAWGERWYGVGRDVKNVLYIRIGSGIGGGLVLNGQPYLGEDFAAGEVGHFTVKPDGPLCLCGNHGCLSTLASTNALVERVGQLLQNEPNNPLAAQQAGNAALTLPDITAALAAGNPVAVQAVEEAGHWIGLAMASIVNLLNLDMVIIGGPIAQAGDVLLGAVRSELAKRAEATHVARVKVVLSALQEDAPAIGSASLVLHQLTSTNPLLTTPLLYLERPSLFKQVGRGGPPA